jgi:hypothetical protein
MLRTILVILLGAVLSCGHKSVNRDGSRSPSAVSPETCELQTRFNKGTMKFPVLGEQYCQENELETFKKLAEDINRIQDKTAQEVGASKPDRGFHAKHHGCLKGVLTVTENLPAKAKFGLFAKQTTYKVIARFSNAVGASESDAKPDARGLAIKVLGRIDNPRISDTEDVPTQDFLMTNQPVPLGKDGPEFMEFASAKSQGLGAMAKFLPTHPRAAKVVGDILKHQVNMYSMATEPFWGGSPYRLGPAQAVKFLVRPAASNKKLELKKIAKRFTHPNYLREDLLERAKTGQIKFDFMMQYQLDPEKNPVEDSLYVWDEKQSVPEKVAELTFFKQDFSSDEKQAYCGRLAMNPWHSLNDHEPLGNLNRARKFVYMSSAAHRSPGGTPAEPSVSDIEQIYGLFQD